MIELTKPLSAWRILTTFILLFCASIVQAQTPRERTFTIDATTYTIPYMGGNQKPTIQPDWDANNGFKEQVEASSMRVLRYPGAEAANVFDYTTGTILPSYKFYKCQLTGNNPNLTAAINAQGNALLHFNRTENGCAAVSPHYHHTVAKYAEHLNDLSRNNKKMIPLFTLNVVNPVYKEVTNLANPGTNLPERNSVEEQLDIIMASFDFTDDFPAYIQLSNEPYLNGSQITREWKGGYDYARKMDAISQLIKSKLPGNSSKISWFLAEKSMDDYKGSNIRMYSWDDSIGVYFEDHPTALTNVAAFTTQDYGGLWSFNCRGNDCNTQCPTNNKCILQNDYPTYTDERLEDASYVISGSANGKTEKIKQYLQSRLYTQGKEHWITEYDLHNNGYVSKVTRTWGHGLFAFEQTISRLTIPNIKFLITNAAVSLELGYRTFDTYSVYDAPTNTYTQHQYTGLSPKGYALKTIYDMAWRNDEMSELSFDDLPEDDFYIEKHWEPSTYYEGKKIKGWAFKETGGDYKDFIFLNISPAPYVIDASLLPKGYTITTLYSDNPALANDPLNDNRAIKTNGKLVNNSVTFTSTPTQAQLDAIYQASQALHVETIVSTGGSITVPPHGIVQIIGNCDVAEDVIVDGLGQISHDGGITYEDCMTENKCGQTRSVSALETISVQNTMVSESTPIVYQAGDAIEFNPGTTLDGTASSIETKLVTFPTCTYNPFATKQSKYTTDATSKLVEGENTSSLFTIAPNPTTQSFRIVDMYKKGIHHISILNLSGQVVYESGPLALYNVQLSPGLYLVQINYNGGSEIQKLLIK